MDDEAIIELYNRRDEAAVSETQRKYGAYCRRIAMNLLGVGEDADECVNDALHAAWTAIPPERPENLFAYLARVCRNLALDRLDRRNTGKRAGEVLMGEVRELCRVQRQAVSVLQDS